MNTQTARQIMNEVAQLNELVATFQATFGRSYQVKPNSPQDAQRLQETIFERECAIARLLDSETLMSPHYKVGMWWNRQDVMDMGVIQALVQEVCHLISCCAYFEVEQRGMSWSYAVNSAQNTIAGLLEPTSLQTALEAIA